MTAGTETKDRAIKHTVSPKGMLIGGNWVNAKSGARIAVENPAKKVTIVSASFARRGEALLAHEFCQFAEDPLDQVHP